MQKVLIAAVILGWFSGCVTTSSVPSLVGHWSTGCIVSADAPTHSEISTATFTATTATFRYNQYADHECTVLMGAGTDVEMSYTLGQAYAPIPSANTIDQIPTSFVLTPHDQNTVTSFNQGRFCGVTTWALHVAQSAASCTDSKSGLTVLAPRYNIVLLTGNALKVGKIDSTHTGLSADKRPVELDQSSLLIRQK